MINFNGTITDDANILAGNRAFLYGDSVFETVKILDGKVLFLEDHYFRLMSAMRIVRMEIPMNFTMEYFEEQILSTAASENFSGSCRARISVYRKEGGFYLPKDNNVSFLITVLPLKDSVYRIEKDQYEVELYKDFIVTKHLLSTIKSSNRMINVTGSIFADENGYDNCLLINDEKNVIEALNGNLFMLMGNKLVTPPISEGCLNGVMRKQILALAKKIETIEVEEAPISPFDLQKADELFITNVVKGIQPITKYRKKEYGMGLAKDLLLRLNAQIRLG
ncbi:aminotransferase class IV [Flavobacterium lindanitolerans]|uniref:aminotransferase class IV n=1 Tax=Flavobacterium lindanitolerans TaxID=428988 RepID=UPI002809B1C7|nr:aminotransferase class IV [Flavobacterium lindanitolerans]MDQ7960104.1 aminotransferase class IV [Flavobacterium lindanitolerans]